MIVLASASPAAEKCAAVLREGLHQAVEVAESPRRALALLHQEKDSCTLLLVDQWLAESDPAAAEVLLQHLGAATPLYVNLAIQGTERILRETRAALERREREQRAALDQAASRLRQELKTDVTGILLASQLALSVPSLPAAAQARLKSVCSFAERIRERLQAF